jgi:hypothetical protein
VTVARAYYVERRAISGLIASGYDPMLRFGGMLEFSFTFWKRVTKIKAMGASGSDKIDLNELGEPDVPAPTNEYYQSKCRASWQAASNLTMLLRPCLCAARRL